MSIYNKIIDQQKLRAAWSKVRKNKPASGVDSVTYEDFDANLKAEIYQLFLELTDHTYEVQPVKMVTLRKEDKLRDVSLYTMRDKVVQVSIAQELDKIFEVGLSDCAYAYRNSKSALIAIGDIESAIVSGGYSFVLKTDVRNFFDCISQEKLKKMLLNKIAETDVVELIMKQLSAPSVTHDGELVDKMVGVYQGSAISPILSNIYMTDFDRAIEAQPVFYARYADDIVVLTSDEETLKNIMVRMKIMLTNLGLELNTEKTYSREISEGFDFLGYHFDSTGKSVPQKAKDKLEQSLEDVWLTMVGSSLEERLVKGSQILNGWEQFYRGEREISNLFEFVSVIYMMRHSTKIVAVAEKRHDFVNTHKDIARYLIEVWQEHSLKDLVLLEYEQYFDIFTQRHVIEDEHMYAEVYVLFEELIRGESEELLTSLLQAYSDLGLYGQSEKIMERIKLLRDKGPLMVRLEDRQIDADDVTTLRATPRVVELMGDLFIGREDMYAREVLDLSKKRRSEFVAEPLTPEVIRKHLLGAETIETYIVRSNETVHYVVFDFDVSKRQILLCKNDESKLTEYLQEAAEEAMRLVNCCKELGLKTYVEFSGYRGYHVWLFFTDWIPARYALSLMEIIEGKWNSALESRNITLEKFPAKSKRNMGSSGPRIKIPFGIHIYSGMRSYFCDETMQPISNPEEMLSSIAKYSLENVKRVIGANISDVDLADPAGSTLAGQKRVIEIDASKLEGVPESVMIVLNGCNLMKYLVNKSITTGYLSHAERWSILNVFGHVGEEGKEFVHTVMSFTLNYQYHVTQKFISKMPEKPVSCVKLRDQYKKITAEYGCSCMFKRTKDCYPSPVIHAIRQNSEENHNITIPVSRTISKSKQEAVYDELNVHVKVQELAGKIVELKKQKRGIDKSIQKVEKELCTIYDNASVDCMEVDMGMLIRHKTENGWKWTIDI